MSDEPKYPPAYGVLLIDVYDTDAAEVYWADIFHCHDSADDCVERETTPDISGMVVELLPRLEVDRMVDEAVAAERERLIAIAEACRREATRSDPQDSTDYDYGLWDAANQILAAIREVAK